MISSGNANSVDAIYRDHHSWLKNWLHRRLGCQQDAADLGHDTFLKVILGGPQPETLREPRAYLMVIASRLLINRHHRKKVEQEALRQVAILLEARDSRDPASVSASQDLLSQVLKMLSDELPEKAQRAFLMARIDGLTYKQIAEHLDVSPSRVKQYLATALAHCHSRLYDSL